MEKIKIEICCGTTCFMLGSNNLLSIEEEMPAELSGKAEIVAVPCLELCNDSNLAGAPYVRINGDILEQATQEKIFNKIYEILEGK